MENIKCKSWRVTRDEVIEINANVSLRIVQLSKTALTVNLILNFEDQDFFAKGEAIELKFLTPNS